MQGTDRTAYKKTKGLINFTMTNVKRFFFMFFCLMGSLYGQEDIYKTYLIDKIQESNSWPINPNTIYSIDDLYEVAYHIGRAQAFSECLEEYDKLFYATRYPYQ